MDHVLYDVLFLYVLGKGGMSGGQKDPELSRRAEFILVHGALTMGQALLKMLGIC